jgi:hypothetical protein
MRHYSILEDGSMRYTWAQAPPNLRMNIQVVGSRVQLEVRDSPDRSDLDHYRFSGVGNILPYASHGMGVEVVAS